MKYSIMQFTKGNEKHSSESKSNCAKGKKRVGVNVSNGEEKFRLAEVRPYL